MRDPAIERNRPGNAVVSHIDPEVRVDFPVGGEVICHAVKMRARPFRDERRAGAVFVEGEIGGVPLPFENLEEFGEVSVLAGQSMRHGCHLYFPDSRVYENGVTRAIVCLPCVRSGSSRAGIARQSGPKKKSKKRNLFC